MSTTSPERRQAISWRRCFPFLLVSVTSGLVGFGAGRVSLTPSVKTVTVGLTPIGLVNTLSDGGTGVRFWNDSTSTLTGDTALFILDCGESFTQSTHPVSVDFEPIPIVFDARDFGLAGDGTRALIQDISSISIKPKATGAFRVVVVDPMHPESRICGRLVIRYKSDGWEEVPKDFGCMMTETVKEYP